MKVLIAIDSFKGSLSSLEAGEAVKKAVQDLAKDVEALVRPLADGGEGTVDALCEGLGGEKITVFVHGPLKEKVEAYYARVGDTAIIEMAAAAGITLLPEGSRNPLNTTTFGVGEMIMDAVMRGCRRFIIGIGGSATNDGGIGMLSALGFEFLDKESRPVEIAGAGLEKIEKIVCENAVEQLAQCEFLIACDVTNPLCGESGCSAVYGPQKGATPEMIEKMDGWLSLYADKCLEAGLDADKNSAGAGAAGGLGFAFETFLGGKLCRGVELILNETRLEDYIKSADIVVTGEGRLDGQTVMGKAPIGVARLAKKHGKRVIAFSGCVTEDAEVCNEHGIDAFFPIVRGVTSLDAALDKSNAYNNLYATAKQVFRLVLSK